MLNVKAFMTINSLVSNDKGVVSIIGEMSPISRTYDRELGEYTDPSTPDYRLTAFTSTNELDEDVELQASDVSFTISVVDSIVLYAKSNLRPYNTTLLLQAVRNQHQDSLNTIEIGEFVDNGVFSLPEWIEITHRITGSRFRIWLSDQAFQQQYDQFVIEVVPYIDNLDYFFGTYGNLVSIINGTSMTQFMDRIQERRNKYPETVLDIMQFDYVNPANPTQVISVPFGILVYGLAGDNVDSKKDAIIDYLNNNSDYSNSEWESIFPGIFKRVEFTVVPRWDKVAVPNLTSLSEIYASVLDYAEIRNFAINAVNHYSAAHVQNNIELVPHFYKNIFLLFVAGDNNDANNDQLRKLYPDFLPISNTMLDFARMTKETRDWSNFFFDLVKTAETLTRFNTVPSSMRRIERNGKLYVTSVHEGVNYLVSAKTNGIFQ